MNACHSIIFKTFIVSPDNKTWQDRYYCVKVIWYLEVSHYSLQWLATITALTQVFKAITKCFKYSSQDTLWAVEVFVEEGPAVPSWLSLEQQQPQRGCSQKCFDPQFAPTAYILPVLTASGIRPFRKDPCERPTLSHMFLALNHSRQGWWDSWRPEINLKHSKRLLQEVPQKPPEDCTCVCRLCWPQGSNVTPFW